MLEVVFSESAAGTMTVAMGNCPDSAVSIIILGDEKEHPQEEIDKIRSEAEQRKRTGWENTAPLKGDRQNIILLPLALSVGRISETEIGAEREAALTSVYAAFPDVASEIAADLLFTARRSYTKLMKRASRGEPVRVWAGHRADEVCGLYWLMEQLRPIGLEKLDVTLVEHPGEWEESRTGHAVYRNSWGEAEPYLFGRMAATGKKLSADSMNALANRWRELQQENMPLRVALNGNLVSAPEELYDPFIRQELDGMEDEFCEATLVGRVLGKYLLGLSDGWVALRIEQFILDGLLAAVTEPPPNEPIYHRILRKL